jgi:hypothetical protein
MNSFKENVRFDTQMLSGTTALTAGIITVQMFFPPASV